MTRAIISLTTIPPRMAHLEPALRSLLAQTAAIERIVLYLPRAYRRKEFGSYRLPDLPRGVDVAVTDTDYGPATKILPALRDYAGQDVLLIYCDDDRIYDPHWAQRLIDGAKAHPTCCFAQRGDPVACIDGRARYLDHRLLYSLKRNLSLGLWKPCETRREGIVDIVKGCSGVLVRPDFFHRDVYNIPDIMWTVDDVWLSGMMAAKGTVCRLDDDPGRFRRDRARPTQADSLAALRDFVYEGHDRWRANKACVDYFRTHYGVLQPGTP